MSYVYLKKTPSPSPSQKFKKVKTLRKYHRPFAWIFFVFGIFFFASAVLPIILYQIEYSIKFDQIITPLSTRFYNRANILGDANVDYTQINNWFVSTNTINSDKNSISPSGAKSYSLSIPILKVNQATVEIGSLDLKKSLIQYPQTALPGQLGNAVVFGHSVLPQFFNPKSYLTIFSTLYRLKQGDEIYLEYDHIQYKYLVEEMYEVQPTDLSVLEQRFDGRYLTLITCTPPGTYIRRLVVKARIVDI